MDIDNETVSVDADASIYHIFLAKLAGFDGIYLPEVALEGSHLSAN